MKETSPNKTSLSIAVILVLAAALVFVLPLPQSTGGPIAAAAAAAERPVTLSPALFNDDPKAKAAYEVAKEIPEILEQLPCFCGCDMHFGHKNNLFCFSDKHGSACDMCESIALTAQELHKKGYPVAKIRQTIIDRFSGSAN